MQKHPLVLLALGAFALFAADANSVHATDCTQVSGGQGACTTIVEANGATRYSEPVGFTADQINQAYSLPGATKAKGNPPIIGVIGAFDAPTILSDLKFYSKTMGIPTLPGCKGAIVNSATPCFQKRDQRGGHDFSKKTDWTNGISIEVEAAHAICQNCSILLIEADDNYSTNLYPATTEAVTLGARFINVGYGIFAQESKTYYKEYDPIFDQPGVLFAAPEPLEGYGYFTYPVTSKYTTAVGATSLYVNSDDSYKSETALTYSTSYCDVGEGKPDWQTDPKCKKRMGADVSMDGDISTGFAMYDSTPNGNGDTGWFLSGGTGLSASLIAGVFAVADHNVADMPSLPYQNYSLSNFHDITTGSNGTCEFKYFCTAVKGYDGPTGLGSPLGIGGF